jgi:hypothetical protein
MKSPLRCATAKGVIIKKKTLQDILLRKQNTLGG